MSLVPHGNTQKGVNQKVYQIISAQDLSRIKYFLDIPCGEGKFASFIKSSYPEMNVVGVDLLVDASKSNFQFHQATASEFVKTIKPDSFEIITCISGVMCFDGLSDLLKSFHQSLKSGGMLVVTNDNMMTIRDRISFLLFGHFKRFKLLYAKNEGNWNVVLPQALVMFFQRNNFKQINIKYTSIYPEDWIFLPLAVLIYPFFILKLIFLKSDLSFSERLSLFPFSSLLARHYIVYANK